jgi:heat shock protein HslJ
MRFLSVTPLALVAILALAACTPGAAAPSAGASGGTAGEVTYEQLDGRSFVVTSAVGYEVVPESEIQITFEEGRIGIQAGCNSMGSQYRVEGGVLSVGDMITTEMACEAPLMAQDVFISNFVHNTALTLDGDTLTMAKDAVTLTLTDSEVANPDLPIEGTTWLVNGIVANQAVSSMPLGVEASLVFEGGNVNVNAGCNTGSGPAELGEGTITFGAIATTRMACEGPAMDAESQILQVLQGDATYEINGNGMTLTSPGGGLVLVAQE